MEDPLVRLARAHMLARAQANSADLEIQFTSVAGSRPVVAILHKAMKAASEAMVGLALVAPTDTEKVRDLQNKIARFDDLVRFCREIIADGEEAAAEITADETEELLDVLTQSEEGRQEAAELGLLTEAITDDA